jgi:photosystem II protein
LIGDNRARRVARASCTRGGRAPFRRRSSGVASTRRRSARRTKGRVALALRSRETRTFFSAPTLTERRSNLRPDRASFSNDHAPNSRSGKAGYVYKLGLRNGKANVDEYSPIYTPEEFKTDGDKYEGDIKLAALAVVGVVGTGALAILLTSAL